MLLFVMPGSGLLSYASFCDAWLRVTKLCFFFVMPGSGLLSYASFCNAWLRVSKLCFFL